MGSAIARRLEAEGFSDVIGRQSDELDLRERSDVSDFFADTKPRYVVLAAAKVGGILANNTYPVDFLSDNLRIQTNVMDAALEHGTERLLFLGSSCIYPQLAPQPIIEDSLLTGHLEPTNDAYAIAKIAGILGVQAVRRQYGRSWISAMPTNLYGPGDNFSPMGSHVLPALIRRYDEAVASGAESVTNWGTGTPRREFLHVDDMAAACLHLLEHYDGSEQVNVGTGRDTTIKEIASLIADVVGYEGRTEWDTSKPDGTPQKLLDVSKLRAAGWEAKIGMREGLESTVTWYRAHAGDLREAG
nr:GDP-L-fucose synthase [Nocardioides sp.]